MGVWAAGRTADGDIHSAIPQRNMDLPLAPPADASLEYFLGFILMTPQTE